MTDRKQVAHILAALEVEQQLSILGDELAAGLYHTLTQDGFERAAEACGLIAGRMGVLEDIAGVVVVVLEQWAKLLDGQVDKDNVKEFGFNLGVIMAALNGVMHDPEEIKPDPYALMYANVLLDSTKLAMSGEREGARALVDAYNRDLESHLDERYRRAFKRHV